MTAASDGAGWRGTAFLAIANTVDPAMQAEYEAWHTFEHVPERLTMQGFLDGKRFISRSRQHYLTLYDLDGPGALETAEYRALLVNPTPLSRKMRPAMGAFRRFAYREAMRSGRGCARHLGFLRWPASGKSEIADIVPLAGLTGQAGIVSLRVGTALATTPHPAFAAQEGSQDEHFVALLSGTDAEGLAATLGQTIAQLGKEALEAEIYDLIVAY